MEECRSAGIPDKNLEEAAAARRDIERMVASLKLGIFSAGPSIKVDNFDFPNPNLL